MIRKAETKLTTAGAYIRMSGDRQGKQPGASSAKLPKLPSTSAGRGTSAGCQARRSSVMRWQRQRSGLPFRQTMYVAWRLPGCWIRIARPSGGRNGRTPRTRFKGRSVLRPNDTPQGRDVAGRARIDGRFYRQLTTGGERQIIPVAVRHQDRPGLKTRTMDSPMIPKRQAVGRGTRARNRAMIRIGGKQERAADHCCFSTSATARGLFLE